LIASAVVIVVAVFLVVFTMARQRASREAQRRADSRKVRGRPQASRRPKERVPAGRRSNMLV
jgi:flagellar biosynthesis/type III secretory pathway M-ring protein FliF/YscJ